MNKLTAENTFNVFTNVVNLDSLNPDPGFWWPKSEEKKAEKKYFFSKSKNAIYFSLDLHKGRPPLQEKHSALKKENAAFQKMKYIDFFLFYSVIAGSRQDCLELHLF